MGDGICNQRSMSPESAPGCLKCNVQIGTRSLEKELRLPKTTPQLYLLGYNVKNEFMI